MPDGWTIHESTSSISFNGDWGATKLIYYRGDNTHIMTQGRSSSGWSSGDYYYDCGYSSQSSCIRINESNGKYYISGGSYWTSSNTNNWKILIRREV